MKPYIAQILASIQSEKSGYDAESAMENDFASGDPALRARAFRQAFESVGVFYVALTPKESTSQKGINNIATYENTISADVNHYDVRTGKFAEIENPVGEHSLVGHLNRDVIQFRNSNCSGSLRNVSGTWTFVGNVSCSSHQYNGEFVLR